MHPLCIYLLEHPESVHFWLLGRLWNHITEPYLHETKQHIPCKALCKLLPDLINGSKLAAATAVNLLCTRLSQLEDLNAVLELLWSAAPALR